ncbi:MAG TPA: hypothetical protein VM553_14960 [Dongiaceae bacterium]|nr:hypothetical protein [Dongiaceae bacterium]
MRAAPIALITALLPFLCIHLTYLVAASHGHVEWCVPYWDSCTSISATGRELPEKLLFKFIMIPAGLLAIVFWWLVNGWLDAVGLRRSHSMFWLGAVAGLFLILYVVALGEGREYQILRRIGIILFFSFSFLAQLLFLARTAGMRVALAKSQSRIVHLQQIAALTLLAIGISSVLLDMLYTHYDNIEDAFEWVMMLFIVAQFGSHYGLWKAAGLRLELRADQT